MGTRGRTSSASLAIVAPAASHRPDPPADLTPEQAEEWRGIVDRMPPDWFTRETHALLAQLCRHVVTARDLARRLQRPKLATRDLIVLLSRQERESRAIESLSRAMRLTQHSRYDRKKTTGPTRTRPWDAS